MISFDYRTSFYTEIPSTQDWAREAAVAGAPEGKVIVARRQTAGRGRLGREWFSPYGGIYFSVVLRPRLAPAEVPKITLAGGVAVAETINQDYHFDALIKWPNDVLINGKKVAGILAEGEMGANGLDFVILGIGINVNTDPSEFPDGFLIPPTSFRAETGKRGYDSDRVMARSLMRFADLYEALTTERSAEVLARFRGLSAVSGWPVTVTTPTEKLSGRALDIDETGALILELESGDRRVIQAGDVTIVPQSRRAAEP